MTKLQAIDWLQAALPMTVTAILLVTVGIPIALALRARGFALISVAVPASVAVLSVAPILAAGIHTPWSVFVPYLVSAAVALALLPLWNLNRNAATGARVTAKRGWQEFAKPLLCAGLGGLLILALLVRFMWGPGSVSQTYDANFHLNLAAQMLESGDASPFHVDLSNPGTKAFYPASWHAIVALVAQLTGGNIAIATNAVTLVVSGIVWPIGVVALSRSLFGPTARVSLIAGITSAMLPSLPYSMAAYGVLYPTLLSLVLLPYALTALVKILRHGRSVHTDPLAPVAQWVLLFGSLGAVGLAQPSGVFAFVILATPAVAGAVLRGIRTGGAHLVWSLLGGLGYLVVVAALWHFGRTSDNGWGVRQNILRALWEGASGAPRLHSAAWILTFLAVVGIVTTLRQRRMRWLGLAWLCSVGFFAIADGLAVEPLRTLITGPWYNDSWRLGAIVAVAAVPLVVFALDRIATIFLASLRRLLRQRDAVTASSPSQRRRTRAIAGVSSVLLLILGMQSPGIGSVAHYVEQQYDPRPSQSFLLDDNELKLIHELHRYVPRGDVLINNPWNGGALAEALSGYEVLIPHTGGNYPKERFTLINGIAEGTPEACAISQRLKARWVLDFGTRYVFNDEERTAPFEAISLIDPERAPALTPVKREGHAVLYRVTGCR